MAITPGFVPQAKQDFLDGVHAAADTYKCAFYASTATIDAATYTTYSAAGEVTNGSACPAGGVTLSGRSTNPTPASGGGYIDWGDISFTVTGTFTARGCVIYNATKSNKVIGVFDFGADKTATDGPFQVQIPSTGSGVVRFA